MIGTRPIMDQRKIDIIFTCSIFLFQVNESLIEPEPLGFYVGLH